MRVWRFTVSGLSVLISISFIVVGLLLTAAQEPRPADGLSFALSQRKGTRERSPTPTTTAISPTPSPTSSPTPTPQPTPWNVELIGRAGGATYAVAGQGTYVYIGVGPRLVVLDISNPTHPMVVGQTGELPDIVQDIYVAGKHTYVVTGKGDLHVIDASNPATPTEVGVYESAGDRIYVAGNYAYLAAGVAGLRVIDISDPTAPTEVGTYETPGAVRDVYVTGGYAYVAEASSRDDSDRAVSGGLRVIDVSDPTAPVEVGYYATSSARGIYVSGEHAYLVTLRALWLIDVSSPGAPVGVSLLSEGAINVYVVEGYAYVADGHSLRIFDVSNPAAPVEVGAYSRSSVNVLDVYAAGRYAYVAAEDAILRVVDVSDPTAPSEVGFYDLPRHATDVYAAGNYAYVADRWSGLRIIDVSDPTAPAQVSAYYLRGEEARVVYVADNYAYVGTRADSLWVIDVSDPTAPVAVSTYPISTTGWRGITGIYAAGDYAYVAAGNALWVVDVRNPAAPQKLGVFATQLAAQSVYVAGGYAYVAAGQALLVVDVSDLAAPVTAGVYPTRGNAWAVYVVGDYAYLAVGSVGLRIIDVSDPTAPTEVGTFNTPGNAYDVHVAGGYAYVTDGETGLQIIDVSNPAAPVIAGYSAPIYLRTLYVSTPYAYVTSGGLYGRLSILRFTPSVSASIPTNGGSLTSPFDGTTYTFPAGTFADTVTINHTPLSADDAPAIGRLTAINHFFEVSAVHSASDQPAYPTRPYTVTVQYTDAEKGPAIESTVALYNWDGTQWVREPTSTVDTEANTVTATPDHFGLWAVLGETRRMYLPVILNNFGEYFQ